MPIVRPLIAVMLLVGAAVATGAEIAPNEAEKDFDELVDMLSKMEAEDDAAEATALEAQARAWRAGDDAQVAKLAFESTQYSRVPRETRLLQLEDSTGRKVDWRTMRGTNLIVGLYHPDDPLLASHDELHSQLQASFRGLPPTKFLMILLGSTPAKLGQLVAQKKLKLDWYVANFSSLRYALDQPLIYSRTFLFVDPRGTVRYQATAIHNLLQLIGGDYSRFSGGSNPVRACTAAYARVRQSLPGSPSASAGDDDARWCGCFADRFWSVMSTEVRAAFMADPIATIQAERNKRTSAGKPDVGAQVIASCGR